MIITSFLLYTMIFFKILAKPFEHNGLNSLESASKVDLKNKEILPFEKKLGILDLNELDKLNGEIGLLYNGDEPLGLLKPLRRTNRYYQFVNNSNGLHCIAALPFLQKRNSQDLKNTLTDRQKRDNFVSVDNNLAKIANEKPITTEKTVTSGLVKSHTNTRELRDVNNVNRIKEHINQNSIKDRIENLKLEVKRELDDITANKYDRESLVNTDSPLLQQNHHDSTTRDKRDIENTDLYNKLLNSKLSNIERLQREQYEDTKGFSDLLKNDFNSYLDKLPQKRENTNLWSKKTNQERRANNDNLLKYNGLKLFKLISNDRLTLRKRRRIDDDIQDRPQQLSDFSDIDLFGALPKSYDGELCRYKRV